MLKHYSLIPGDFNDARVHSTSIWFDPFYCLVGGLCRSARRINPDRAESHANDHYSPKPDANALHSHASPTPSDSNSDLFPSPIQSAGWIAYGVCN
jgi:hypothetical protein